MATEVFYPDEEFCNYDEAQAICSTCPVRIDCIDAAVTSPFDEEGYWGETPYVIRELKERRRTGFGDYADEVELIAEGLAELNTVKV